MKVFIWDYVDQCTTSYHSGGGVVVFAEDEATARSMANTKQGCSIRVDEMPDHVHDVAGAEPKVIIFPNAGCC